MNSRTARAGILVAFIAVAVALFVFLQDSDDDSGDGSGSSTTEQSAQGTTPAPPPEPARDVIQLRGGEPVGGVQELTYTSGDQVRITVKLDEPQEEVHLHGYDIEYENPAGSVDFDFKADIEGIFELEAHGPNGDVLLAEITVEPS